MAGLNEKRRALDEVSHYFFSSTTAQPENELDDADCPDLIGQTAETQFLGEEKDCGLILVDADNKVLSVNQRAEFFLGVTRESYIGQIFNYSTSANKPFPVSIVRADGKTGIGEMEVVPAGQNLGTFWAVIRDISTKRIP